jgi:hypothetical protein
MCLKGVFMDAQHAIDRIKELEMENRNLLTVIDSLREKRSKDDTIILALRAQLRDESLTNRPA